MGETVQHFFAFAEALHSQTVVFLVQEEAGLLPVFHIHQIAHAVFQNLYFRVKRLSDKSFQTFHSFLLPDFGVAPFIDPADTDPVLGQYALQDLQDGEFQPVNSQSERFHHQHIRKFIHHQTRQKIRFAENEPAAAGITHRFPVVPRVSHPAFQKCFINEMFFLAGHKAHPDLRVYIDKTVSHKIPVKIVNSHQITIFKSTQDAFDLVVIDPHSPCFDGAAFPLFQRDDCMIHIA